MIELLYFASQIQCGAGGDFLNVRVDVFHEQQLVQTMKVNDRVLVPVESVDELTFEYSVVNNTTNCSLKTASEMSLTPTDNAPSIAGVYEQDSVQTLINGLNQYEELFLVELGTTDSNSAAFDLQDVIFKVDTQPNPELSLIYAD